MEKIKRHMNWILATGGFLVLTIGVLFFFIVHNQTAPTLTTAQMPEPTKIDINEPENDEKKTSVTSVIMIDVQGSVKRPGVYKMNQSDRVIHAIKKAGGFLAEAEVKSVNQAQKISDEMVIYVAKKGENYNTQTQGPHESKININTADLVKLQELSGVGPAKAESIIAYREEQGPFTSIEQLLEVRGIGEKTIEDWKDKIVLQ